FTAWIFSFEENLAIKNAPPIVRLCLTIGVHFIISETAFFDEIYKLKNEYLLIIKFVNFSGFSSM
ncbi:hypothetical protein ACPCH0_24480, partial [Bacillus bombysepticus]